MSGSPTWSHIEGPTVTTAHPEVLRRWRSEHRAFFALVILLDGADVELRRRSVARALHPWCSSTTPGQAHVTLAVLGDGDLAPGSVPLGRRFEVRVSGADSFTSAAFLHARADGLEQIRSDVLDAVTTDFEPARPWVPHVTVGTYRWPLAAHHVEARLLPWRWASERVTTGRLAMVEVVRSSRTGRLVRA